MSDAARLAAVFTGFLLVASVPVALAAASTSGLRSQAASLRASDQSLEARAKSATLELYALEAELADLAAAAADRSRALTEAVASRVRFVAALRQQQGLNAARIASIEAQAQRAEARTVAISTTVAPVATAVVDTDALAAPLEPIATSGGTLTVSTTGYTLRGRTATGVPTTIGVVAVDPAVIPLGTRMTIPGYGEAIAADTGGAVHGNVIDLWFPSVAQALRWGRRTVTITIR